MSFKNFITGFVCGCAAACTGLYVYSIKPNLGRREKMRPLFEHYIAHRGLFDNKSNRPENSINAFRAAVEKNYGIELDVQSTADGKVVVFHDSDLYRMCGVDKKVSECDYAELKTYPLLDSDEVIPTFEEVLEVVDSKVPLVVEIKPDGDWLGTARKLSKILDSYQGYYCVESFNPSAVEWFRLNRPNVIRGQLSTDYFKQHPNKGFVEKALLTSLCEDYRSRPDFIAYDYRYKDMLGFRMIKLIYPEVVSVAWTIKSQWELDQASADYDCYIFDDFLPRGTPLALDEKREMAQPI